MEQNDQTINKFDATFDYSETQGGNSTLGASGGGSSFFHNNVTNMLSPSGRDRNDTFHSPGLMPIPAEIESNFNLSNQMSPEQMINFNLTQGTQITHQNNLNMSLLS